MGATLVAYTGTKFAVRAICEGLAYTARHCFESAGRSGRIVVAGGGTGSSAWMQVFADVLEVPLQIARTPEVGARGALLLHPGDIALAVGGVNDDEPAIGEAIDEEIVDRAAIGIAHHRVARRILLQRGHVVGDEPLEVGERVGAADDDDLLRDVRRPDAAEDLADRRRLVVDGHDHGEEGRGRKLHQSAAFKSVLLKSSPLKSSGSRRDFDSA